MKFPTGKTVGGYKFRVYHGRAGGEYPIHGAVWSKELKEWIPTRWSLRGDCEQYSMRDISPLVMDRLRGS